MSLDTLAEAQATARSVLSGVSTDQLTDPSPCTEWDVAGVIDHLVGAQYWFLQAVSAPSSGDTAAKASSGDFKAAFDAAANSVMDALSVEGFAARSVELPFGTYTGAQFIDFVGIETLAHSWDVAMATSQDTDLAPAAAAHLLEVARAMMGGEERSESANFGSVQPCAQEAAAADHLAAYLGRRVKN